MAERTGERTGERTAESVGATPVWTRSRLRAAATRGMRDVQIPRGSIVTPDARDLARDLGLRLVVGPVSPRTGAAFLASMRERARRADRTIVLPEGTEPRICEAAARVVADRLARLILLGPQDAVEDAARAAGLDPADVTIWDPLTCPHRDAFEQRYLEARAHKGVTADQARAAMGDVSYFGTMMVAEGLADGMVSGAAHTTAHTVRPALEILRAPDDGLVSSAFFMCLPPAPGQGTGRETAADGGLGTHAADGVLLYADCAVNVSPTAQQVAAIAVTSADTARRFGIDPRVALLSYATHGSGAGPDVDLVREATALVHAAAPDLPADGPLQYDAAVDPGVAARKAPDSPVAGRATVLVFPDLSAGNIAYKAVQRSAGAVAVGPVLQGLTKPVNDLSRGATVDDIIATVAVTALQAATPQSLYPCPRSRPHSQD